MRSIYCGQAGKTGTGNGASGTGNARPTWMVAIYQTVATMKDMQHIYKEHGGFEIKNRLVTMSDRYGFPEQYLHVRLRHTATGKIAQWSSTVRRWQYKIEELASEMMDGNRCRDCGAVDKIRCAICNIGGKITACHKTKTVKLS